ncbi:MAG: Flp pilus assembly protein TadD, partial [Kiritimatiellia bacterium]
YARELAHDWPEFALGQLLLVRVAMRVGSSVEAMKAASVAVQLVPDDPVAWRLLGQATGLAGEHKLAVEALRKSIDLAPGSMICRNLLVNQLRALRLHDEALLELNELTRRQPLCAETHAHLAVLHEELRDLTMAQRHADLALAIEPAQPHALHVCSIVAEQRKDYVLCQSMLVRLLQLPISVELRVHGGLRLARVLDKQGDPGEAWSMMLACQELRRTTPSFARQDLEKWPRLLTETRDWALAHLDRDAPCVLVDDAPAFVVGFPRSGTTLVEQMIDSHPNLATIDELPILENLVLALPRLLGRDFSYPRDLDTMSDDERLKVIQAWRQRLGTQAGRVVDKLPLNVPFLPLARYLFPDAPVLFVLRDPRDAITSCVFQDMTPNSAMVHLADPVAAANLYDGLLSAWQVYRRLPGLNYREQRYEDLLVEPETVARGMIEHLGQDWDPIVLRYHERASRKTISTPSYMAVSQPINRSALGRWTRHSQGLAPVLSTLERWVEAFGYAPSMALDELVVA